METGCQIMKSSAQSEVEHFNSTFKIYIYCAQIVPYFKLGRKYTIVSIHDCKIVKDTFIILL